MNRSASRRGALAALVASAWCGVAGPVAAHDIPARVTVVAFVKPEGRVLRVLVRAPLEAMRDIQFPVRGPGYLDLAGLGTRLEDAARIWIAGSLEPRGALTIDAGAVRALRAGKSLLPAGVIKVEGEFGRGDAVLVRGPDGHEVGRGLVAYDAGDAEKIKGRSSADVLLILGYTGRTEMIHRDDLVLGGE